MKAGSAPLTEGNDRGAGGRRGEVGLGDHDADAQGEALAEGAQHAVVGDEASAPQSATMAARLAR